VLAMSLGDWELGNSGSREELILIATVLRRLKTAWGFEQGDRLWPAWSQFWPWR